jgi:hypothetical protein
VLERRRAAARDGAGSGRPAVSAAVAPLSPDEVRAMQKLAVEQPGKFRAAVELDLQERGESSIQRAFEIMAGRP